ncbi:MAG TPA: methyltransferase domain-containing protein, partial [Spirochaetia bacterium]|nr:methyltransferase domain-containing protein [Spirochaetia bacterium]
MAQKKPADLKGPQAGSAGRNTLSFVFLPATAPGEGLGHLARALSLASQATSRGRVFVDPDALRSRPELSSILRSLPARKRYDSLEAFPPDSVPVLDMRRTPSDLAAELAERFPLCGIDEGGPERTRFAFLIDTLPGRGNRDAANLQALPCEPPSARRPARPTGTASFSRVLISFGGEDRAGLGRTLVEALLQARLFSPRRMTVVEGPLSRPGDWPEKVRIVRGCRSLGELVGEYDLLFTHFGIGAYEAVLAGVSVVLVNPSGYHRALARREGFPEIGVSVPRLGRLRRLLSRPGSLEAAADAIRERTAARPALESVLAGLSGRGRHLCPVCGSPPGPALARFPAKTYFRCPACAVIWLSFWGAPRVYHDAYFFEEYRAQYGRTYLEDFLAIKQSGRERLRLIFRFLRPRPGGGIRPGKPRLLDAGAAYGPFLAAAAEHGCEAEGIELNSAAARYVRTVLKIPCRTGDFATARVTPEIRGAGGEPRVRFTPNSYDIITMWYILEHFDDPAGVLSKVNRLLKPGGVFALATPSAAGVSFLKNKRRFCAASPDDHATVWTPRGARSVLARFGFSVRAVRSTGHHPERFWKRLRGGIPAAVVGFFSRLLCLGDTFELYAVKT